jgi:hypothetical protein
VAPAAGAHASFWCVVLAGGGGLDFVGAFDVVLGFGLGFGLAGCRCRVVVGVVRGAPAVVFG